MTAIDRTSPMPLWAQVLHDLRRRLAAGEFRDGFPSDAALIAEYPVSRQTVREAVRRLHDEGVLKRERGRGTSVRQPAIEQPWGALYSLFRSIEAQGFEQRSRVLDLSEATDPDIAGRLGLPRSTRLVRLERLRLVDGEPLAHDTAWLPARAARPLLDVDFGHTALYDELSRTCGVTPTDSTEWINTVLPSPDERRLLDLGARQPIFSIDRFSLAGNEPIEWRTTLIRSDRYTFVARWSPASRYEAALEPRRSTKAS
jgi:GntR family transcriptional regulator